MLPGAGIVEIPDEVDGRLVVLIGGDHEEGVGLRLADSIDFVRQFAALAQIMAHAHHIATLRVIVEVGALRIIEHRITIGEKRCRHVHRRTFKMPVSARARCKRACKC